MPDFMSIPKEKPVCPSCGTVVIWGVSTMFDDKTNSDICCKCGAVIAKK
jgi:hypothetical protein